MSQTDFIQSMIIQAPNLMGLLLLSAALWRSFNRVLTILEKELDQCRDQIDDLTQQQKIKNAQDDGPVRADRAARD